jgi:LPPG:FO 2-phospho-L-lactate transferase
MKMVVLAGGVGGSKLLVGLQQLIAAEDLTIIVNTGDNIELFGLYIAPDLDIVTYTLAGVVRAEMGWGIEGDTFACLERLVGYRGEERWFNLGDRDLATHLYRTQLMREGVPLHEVTDRVRRHFGLGMAILPMSNQHTPTTVLTDEGPLHFQEYLIRRRTEPRVTGLRFEGIESARPAPGVLDAIATAEAIVLAPSNPLISIGPILAVPGIREALQARKGISLAVSPIVGGASLKGPTDRMLRDLGMEVTATTVAQLLEGILDRYLLDQRDAAEAPAIRALGLEVATAQTVMGTTAEKVALAQTVLDWLGC